MRFLINKINPFVLAIILIPLILNLNWFREGNIMATAESGIPFYNPKLQLQINSSAWSEYALGVSANISAALVPTFWVLSLLTSFGIPPFILQASLYWLVLSGSGIAIYFLTKELLPARNNLIYLTATLFYWFNPFSLINIWNRFLYNFQLSYVLLPLSFYLFIKGLKLKSYKYSFLIGFASLIFSYALTAITFDIILWSVLLFVALYNFFFSSTKERIFIIKYTLLTLIFWILINFWWISQVFSYILYGGFNTVSAKTFTLFSNYQTFSILSSVLGNISDLVRLRHNYFFNNEELKWIRVFNFPLLNLLNFFITILILIPIFFIKKRVVFFAGTLFLIGIFLSKGNIPPFGLLNDYIFVHIPSMQLFRNPFEKFGFLILLSSTLLLVTSLDWIGKRMISKFKTTFYTVIILLIGLIWGMPFWTGKVFIGSEFPTNDPKIGYKVKVPDYYSQAANWLESQKEDFRIIVFPLGGEGITYTWEKGYSGIELTNQLLPKPAISLGTNIPYYGEITKNLEKLFITSDSLQYIANNLNVKYILYRPDINWQIRKIKNPKEVLTRLEDLEKRGEIKKVAKFGELIFWEIMKKDKQKIYTSSAVMLNYSNPDFGDLQFGDTLLTIDIAREINNLKSDYIDKEIIHPDAKFFMDHEMNPIFEIRQDKFPYVSVLPHNPIYPAVQIKDLLEEKTIKDSHKLLEYKIAIHGKRLVEAKISSDLNDEIGVKRSISSYKNQIVSTFNLIKDMEASSDEDITQPALQSKYYFLFSEHIKVLEDLKERFKSSSETYALLDYTLKDLRRALFEAKIYPLFGFLKSNEFSIQRRLAFSFNVKNSGEYELLWDDKILNNFYKLNNGDKVTMQLDNNLTIGEVRGDNMHHVSFGTFKLEKGYHEIGFNLPEAINLLDNPSDKKFSVDHGSLSYFYPINNLDPYSNYNISFSFLINKGNGPQVLVYDKKPSGITADTKAVNSFKIGPDLYDFTKKNYFTGFKLDNAAEQATVAIKAVPWNNCESIFYTNKKERCLSESFKKAYDKTTDFDIHNLNVTRDFTDSPILIKRNPTTNMTSPAIEFQKISSTLYKIKIKNSQAPFFLIFSELFDPGWRLLNNQGDYLNSEHILANGYANSWYIDKIGDYELILKFVPQDLLDFGENISWIISILGLLIIIYSFCKERLNK